MTTECKEGAGFVHATCGKCGADWSNVPEVLVPLKACFLCDGTIDKMEESVQEALFRGRNA